MNETIDNPDQEPCLSAKRNDMIRECDRLIDHFDSKAHESKMAFRLFRYSSVILSFTVAALSSVQTAKEWSLLQIILAVLSSIAALSTTLLAATNAQEHWIQSRSTQQKLQVEKLLFLQDAEKYSSLENKDKIKTFCEQVMIIWSSGHEKWERSSKQAK